MITSPAVPCGKADFGEETARTDFRECGIGQLGYTVAVCNGRVVDALTMLEQQQM